MKFDYLVRNFEAGDLLEKFLISAVVSILIIRAFLALTNYPQIGNSEYHIAHMLFGGLFMTISLFGVLIFLNREIRIFGAILGGIGFGTFIDELGKFITNDNNYFFEPTIAVIYVIFIAIYFVYKIVDEPRKVTSKEYAVNAIELVREVVLQDFEYEEKIKAEEFLKKSDQRDPVVSVLNKMIYHINTIPAKKKNIFIRIKDKIKSFYSKLTKNKFFATSVIIFFGVTSTFEIISALEETALNNSFAVWGILVSSSFSGIFVLFGIYFLIIKKRLASYKMFKLSILISIFLTQFFLFFKEQLSAITRIIISLIILTVLHNLIDREKMVLQNNS